VALRQYGEASEVIWMKKLYRETTTWQRDHISSKIVKFIEKSNGSKKIKDWAVLITASDVKNSLSISNSLQYYRKDCNDIDDDYDILDCRRNKIAVTLIDMKNVT
jgi:hypothetical protein